MKNAKGFTLIEVLIVIIIVAILSTLFVGKGGGFTVGDGDRVGIVTKISHTGIFWKTWEGQMILGGQGTVTTNVWEFSVTDPVVVKKIEEVLNSQEMVKLRYNHVLIPWPWYGYTSYFVTEVSQLRK